MKSITRKFVLAVLSLALTGAALTVGVYAWFTISSQVSVDQFEGQVMGSSGLLISLDGGTDAAVWSGSITTDAIQNQINESNFERFGEVTSKDGWNLLTRGGNPAGATSYIEFNLYFAATEEINHIAVSDLLITSPGATTFPSEIVTGETLTNHASNAARVSIMESESVGTVFEQAENEDGNTLNKGTFGVWPATGVNYAVAYYNAVAAGNNSLTPITNADFEGVSLVETVEAAQGLVESNTVVANNPETEGPIISGLADYTKKFTVTVRVWIEGWDQEAYNAILNGKFGVTMGFLGVQAVPGE